MNGSKISIGERLDADLTAMRSLPAAPFEACDLQSGQVTSTSQVRYRGNDYSVPVAYGHREVWIKGFVDRVVIGCAAETIAEHPRSYDTGDMVFDPVHYLPLIERKIMSFDQAAPLQGWNVNAGLKLLHSPERKYLSLTGIGLSIDPHSGVPPNSDAVVRGCGQTGGRCLGFRLCLTVGCV